MATIWNIALNLFCPGENICRSECINSILRWQRNRIIDFTYAKWESKPATCVQL